MPVFLPGWGLAASMASFLGLPATSCRIRRKPYLERIASAPGPTVSEFLAIHLSGGTTELTHVVRDKHTHRLSVDLWGRTSDLHAGQFVDRLGVSLGLSLPRRAALESWLGKR